MTSGANVKKMYLKKVGVRLNETKSCRYSSTSSTSPAGRDQRAGRTGKERRVRGQGGAGVSLRARDDRATASSHLKQGWRGRPAGDSEQQRPGRTLEGDLVVKVGVVEDLVRDLAAEVLAPELVVLELEVVADRLAGQLDLVVKAGAPVGGGPPVGDRDGQEQDDKQDEVERPAGEEGQAPLDELGREQDEDDVVDVVEGGAALGGKVGRRDDAGRGLDRVLDGHRGGREKG